jgi:hypothetical protein
MKKILLMLCCSLAASSAFAQLPTFGIRGGVNFAKFSGSDGENGGSTNSVTTFAIGAFADFKTGDNFSIQPGLSYTGKGSEGTDETTGNPADIKTFYLQVPVNLVYHIPAAFGNVYLGAGPYLGIGLSGKVKGRNGSTLDEDIHFGDGTDGFKRTEVGLNGIAGFEFKGGLILGLNYDMGLTSIIDADPITLKNRVFGISIGYKF